MVKLKGSSMIEAIVASLIFLAVFAISLTTLTGLTLREDESYVLLEAERQMTNLFDRYSDGTWLDNTYTDRFEWGEITTIVAPYEDYKDVQQIVMLAQFDGSRKTLEHRQLITLEDE